MAAQVEPDDAEPGRERRDPVLPMSGGAAEAMLNEDRLPELLCAGFVTVKVVLDEVRPLAVWMDNERFSCAVDCLHCAATNMGECGNLGVVENLRKLKYTIYSVTPPPPGARYRRVVSQVALRPTSSGVHHAVWIPTP